MASDRFTNHPPQSVERDSLLARIKRKAGFWLTISLGGLVIFLILGLVYGLAVSSGMISQENMGTTWGVFLGFVATVWLFGQWAKMKFGYSSIFD